MADKKNWLQVLAYVTGSINQELLLRNEYLAAEKPHFRWKCSRGGAWRRIMCCSSFIWATGGYRSPESGSSRRYGDGADGSKRDSGGTGKPAPLPISSA